MQISFINKSHLFIIHMSHSYHYHNDFQIQAFFVCDRFKLSCFDSDVITLEISIIPFPVSYVYAVLRKRHPKPQKNYSLKGYNEPESPHFNFLRH